MQASDFSLVCQISTSDRDMGNDTLSTATTQTHEVDAACASSQISTVWCLGIYATFSLCHLVGLYTSLWSGGEHKHLDDDLGSRQDDRRSEQDDRRSRQDDRQTWHH